MTTRTMKPPLHNRYKPWTSENHRVFNVCVYHLLFIFCFVEHNRLWPYRDNTVNTPLHTVTTVRLRELWCCWFYMFFLSFLHVITKRPWNYREHTVTTPLHTVTNRDNPWTDSFYVCFHFWTTQTVVLLPWHFIFYLYTCDCDQTVITQW